MQNEFKKKNQVQNKIVSKSNANLQQQIPLYMLRSTNKKIIEVRFTGKGWVRSTDKILCIFCWLVIAKYRTLLRCCLLFSEKCLVAVIGLVVHGLVLVLGGLVCLVWCLDWFWFHWFDLIWKTAELHRLKETYLVEVWGQFRKALLKRRAIICYRLVWTLYYGILSWLCVSVR